MARASYFSLGSEEALSVLKEVVDAISQWKMVATSAAVGLNANEIDEFAPAFEHGQTKAARAVFK